MKTPLLILFVVLMLSLNAQNYTFVRGTFNTSGGFQENANFSANTAVGEPIQGEVSTNDYTSYLGFLFPQLNQSPPIITSIDDVPNDQGRNVQIVWNKCAFDDVYDLNTYYSVWRFDEDFGNRNIAGSSNKNSIIKENVYSEPWQVVEQFQIDSEKTYYWENDREVWTFVDTVRALQFDQYSYIAETFADSSASSTNLATFKVVFHDEYAYYESESAEGYSTDDIAPDATKAEAALVGNNVQLNWNEVSTGTLEGNTYEEINGIWYKIYSADTPNFVCGETTFLETVTSTNYTTPVNRGMSKFFKIVVSDKP